VNYVTGAAALLNEQKIPEAQHLEWPGVDRQDLECDIPAQQKCMQGIRHCRLTHVFNALAFVFIEVTADKENPSAVVLWFLVGQSLLQMITGKCFQQYHMANLSSWIYTLRAYECALLGPSNLRLGFHEGYDDAFIVKDEGDEVVGSIDV
jgi:hypothetical protein